MVKDNKSRSAIVNDLCSTLMDTVEDYIGNLPKEQRWRELPLQSIAALAVNTIMNIDGESPQQLVDDYCQILQHLVKITKEGKITPTLRGSRKLMH